MNVFITWIVTWNVPGMMCVRFVNKIIKGKDISLMLMLGNNNMIDYEILPFM